MKTINKYMLLTVVLLMSLTACREQFEDVDTVSFDVTTESVVCKVGQPVQFLMQGNPDMITFYSGEIGNEYAYKDQDRMQPVDMGYSFSSNRKHGPNPVLCPLSYSTDFSGEYTAEAVQAATWVDISDRFVFIPANKDNSETFSEMANISDIFPDEQTPVYFNYHYVCVANKAERCSDWLIYSPTVYGLTGTSEIEMYDLVDMNWRTVYNEPTWLREDGTYDTKLNDANANNGKRLRMICTDQYPNCDREMWFVSGPIFKMASLNNGPDFGTPIKGVANPAMASYSYAYREPGEYTVTFVAANVNVYDRKERVVELKVKIVEDEGTITPPEQEEWN